MNKYGVILASFNGNRSYEILFIKNVIFFLKQIVVVLLNEKWKYKNKYVPI